ncbi:MAG: TetR/AcrR family transcriptional regulator [Labedaea sp.]
MTGAKSVARRAYGGRSAADRRAERPERLMNAGLQLFGTEGYAATSIERLCADAGVSTRNFYEEFTGREDLLMRLYDRIIERSVGAVRAAFEQAGDAPAAVRLERAVRAFVTTTASDPRWARLSYVEVVGVSDAVEAHRIAWREKWAALLIAEAERAVSRGEARPSDFRLGAVGLIGAVNELAHHHSVGAGRGGSLDDVIAEIVRIAAGALGTREPYGAM